MKEVGVTDDVPFKKTPLRFEYFYLLEKKIVDCNSKEIIIRAF